MVDPGVRGLVPVMGRVSGLVKSGGSGVCVLSDCVEVVLFGDGSLVDPDSAPVGDGIECMSATWLLETCCRGT